MQESTLEKHHKHGPAFLANCLGKLYYSNVPALVLAARPPPVHQNSMRDSECCSRLSRGGSSGDWTNTNFTMLVVKDIDNCVAKY